ncbi:helix-turn-helix domain-containing protein [Vibrio crassostreae]|uniref:helix-turn-helix domain-containing protein n=1 Tax=Vibrio crassostreae TaxID=246167 RepID=UPI001B302FE8|nr:helix-turn-helix domain-containing protein [Vibrio crassostreae]CAK2384119.1 Transcriptional regulator [Vibrio crassostreae]CAK2444214.1 Transcriptional regulator [Vibrio crassostreae]CAK2556905.1 Transcriptional regulator [Vibrio crassostreae]CAK2563880.1 Transcriptional regulator [Vibrio crassostreae]CAK2813359.1 Transcriptional regulator [Vibrio crassostreae]
MSSKPKIPPFNYLSGSDFTENLKHLTKSKTILEMAERFDVKKTTFSTWNTHNRTSHELMVRLHLALGIPIEELALPEEERAKLSRHQPKTITEQPSVQITAASTNPQHQALILKSFCLSGGKLLDTGEIPYPLRRVNSFSLQNADLIELETNEAIMLVDKNDNDAVSGSYLISIDGRHSINEVQRLPGKLLVEFNGTTIETQDGDIEVVGKVVTETRKR